MLKPNIKKERKNGPIILHSLITNVYTVRSKIEQTDFKHITESHISQT